MNKKLIFATIGPSSMNKETIQKMDKSGVDIFRINLSHTESCNFEKIINDVSKWTKKPICPDTEGAQLRTGKLSQEELIVKTNDIVELVGVGNKSSNNVMPLNIYSPNNIFLVGDLVKIDFEEVLIQIIKINTKSVVAEIITGGIIRSNKGISVDRQIDLPYLTEKDIEVIAISNRLNIKTIFLSFCSNGESIKELRSLFDYKITIISKVESQSGLINIDEICIYSDGILIDRGDLSRDVAIEKIAFAQSYIMEKGIKHKTPVFTATNFLESMIEKPKPTRAEINDIVSTLASGGSGIVLAAETAIGKYPVDCVRIVSRIIRESNNPKYFSNGAFNNQSVDYLLSLSMDGIIKPHGKGELVQQSISNIDYYTIKNLPSLKINDKTISDVIQISEGVYTPLTGFMCIKEIESVLSNNKLLTDDSWTLPIVLQITQKDAAKLPGKGEIILIDSKNGERVGVLDIQSVEKFNSGNFIKSWFGTEDKNHPGVKEIINNGNYIVSGTTFLFNSYRQQTKMHHEYSPKQTREIFYHNGWYNIVGFHTRNIPHTGHEHIQIKALEISNADAILLSPVTGIKKTGDFSSDVIIACYQKLITKEIYKPKGALLSGFNTYSRYAGPREAIFTAICRKNFGCNSFIIGRDHTGVGDFYLPNASQKIFDRIDLDMNILLFETVSYCTKRNIVTDDFKDPLYKEHRHEISATDIRDHLRKLEKIPSYLIRSELSQFLSETFINQPENIFCK
jgi:pyruvate kinase